ncbi:MAG TPA: hypothetical protein VHJ78_13480 [Actinomycetota bacterium]|nr:hypothetical protein [Actinomycetota bacterium]
MANDKYLGIYLNDHLAILVAARELAHRSEESNQGSPLGKLLSEIRETTEQEVSAVRDLMKAHDVTENPTKSAGAWLAERVGRLKLNGQITGYSDLSRLVELEGLDVALEAKRMFWDALEQSGVERAGELRSTEMAGRAVRHLDELQSHRTAAAKQALGVVENVSGQS